ncbi:30405_t:CDS:2, partial [Racocetra persica]
TLGNKDELGERLNTHFDKKKGKLPSNLNDANSNAGFLELVEGQSINNDNDLIEVEIDFVSENKEPLELKSHLGSEYNFKNQAGSTSGISHLRNKEYGQQVPKLKVQTDVVPVDMFLSALNNIERKIDYNFEALQDQCFKETEQESLLSEAWPRVKLEKPCDQYEYDFLIGGEIESRAVTFWLANDRGWKVALQVVGGNDKMMQKYKDQIGMVTSALPSIGANTWNYSRKFFKRNYRKSQIKRKYRVESASTSSESESEERKKEKMDTIPFATKGHMDQMDYQSQLYVITAEESGISHPTALQLTQKYQQKDLDSNKMIDNARHSKWDYQGSRAVEEQKMAVYSSK